MPCEPFFRETKTSQPLVVELLGPERWTIGDRLRQLEIPVTCTMGQPLRIEVSTAQAAVQCWSVMRSHQASRSQLADWLEDCFKIPVSK
jgi:uncharacterized protein YcbX